MSSNPAPLGGGPIRSSNRLNQVALAIRISSLTAVLAGLLALVGWIGKIPLFKSVLNDAVEMKANTALGLIVAGVALWILHLQRPANARRAGQLMSVAVALLGLATLSQYLFGWQLSIDELIVPDLHGIYAKARGRMSPHSALALIGIGTSLALVPYAHRQTPALIAAWFASCALAIALLSILGYIWRINELTTDIVLPPMALNTALVLVFLAAGILLAIRERKEIQHPLSVSMKTVEGRILAGFILSFLLLALGAGLTYRATIVFTSSVKSVSDSQGVRNALSQLYAYLSDAGLAQRSYLITGEDEQQVQYRQQLSMVDAQTEWLRRLVGNNQLQRDNLRSLQPLVDRARELLDQGIALYQTQGFAAAKKLVDSGQGQLAMDAISSVIQRMDAIEQDLLVQRESESTRFQRYMLWSMMLTILAGGSIFAALFREIHRDMLARQIANQALLDAKNAADLARQEADRTSHAKSTFLATMSHEIRTPMNGVLGMLEILSLTPLNASQKGTLALVRSSGKSLMQILDDILDFSKIEVQKLELRAEFTNLRDLMEDVHALYAGNARSKGLQLACHVDDRLERALMVDALRLRQILNNLVSNAIKFTASGQVEVTADLVERQDNEEHVRFCVKDTGVGVSLEHQLRLFLPFSQADATTSHHYGGTGLGLAICRRLADLMGGSISMVSEPGKGTTIIVDLTLPVADLTLLSAVQPAAADETLFSKTGTSRIAPSVAQAEVEGTLILLADDHPTNRTLLMHQLNLLGYAAESARTGVDALRMWETGRFALLLTDCNMPEMDGYELANAVRARESAGSIRRHPIIACTANAFFGGSESFSRSGMDDCLTKPVELKALQEKLERWLPLARETDKSPQQRVPAVTLGKAIPINHAALARVSGGDAALEQNIFKEFQRVNHQDVAQLELAVQAGDTAKVTRLAHLIKGACAMVGAMHLGSLCERMERGNRSSDWTVVTAAMREFHHEVASLDSYFAEFKGRVPAECPDDRSVTA